MSQDPPEKNVCDPLHGVTLERVLTDLVDWIGWGPMARAVDIACFKSEPSIPSSLKFLRKTPWARTKVERLYVNQRRKRRRPAPARA